MADVVNKKDLDEVVNKVNATNDLDDDMFLDEDSDFVSEDYTDDFDDNFAGGFDSNCFHGFGGFVGGFPRSYPSNVIKLESEISKLGLLIQLILTVLVFYFAYDLLSDKWEIYKLMSNISFEALVVLVVIGWLLNVLFLSAWYMAKKWVRLSRSNVI